MKLLVDNSIVFKLFIEEDKSSEARQLFSQGCEILFLDFTLIEAANSFVSAVRRARITETQAIANFNSLKLLAQNIVSAQTYLLNAHEFALQIQHSVYDCLYAIAARENNAILATADAKFAQKLDPQIFKTLVV